MRKILFMMLLFPVLISGQEYGEANAAKKIVVARFETPFKTDVFTQFAQKMADAGYHVTVVTPDKFVAPAAGTLTVYGEGALKGQPWSDELRAYIAKNANSIYLHTFKRGAVPPVAKGVDVISSASKANVAQTVTALVAKATAKLK